MSLDNHWGYSLTLSQQYMHSVYMPLSYTCSSPKMFAPQGPALGGKHIRRASSGNIVNDIHDHPESEDLHAKLGLDLNGGTSHTISAWACRVSNTCLRPIGGVMNPNASAKGTSPPYPHPPLQTPHILLFSGECMPETDQIIDPMPSKACSYASGIHNYRALSVDREPYTMSA